MRHTDSRKWIVTDSKAGKHYTAIGQYQIRDALVRGGVLMRQVYRLDAHGSWRAIKGARFGLLRDAKSYVDKQENGEASAELKEYRALKEGIDVIAHAVKHQSLPFYRALTKVRMTLGRILREKESKNPWMDKGIRCDLTSLYDEVRDVLDPPTCDTPPRGARGRRRTAYRWEEGMNEKTAHEVAEIMNDGDQVLLGVQVDGHIDE